MFLMMRYFVSGVFGAGRRIEARLLFEIVGGILGWHVFRKLGVEVGIGFGIVLLICVWACTNDLDGIDGTDGTIDLHRREAILKRDIDMGLISGNCLAMQSCEPSSSAFQA